MLKVSSDALVRLELSWLLTASPTQTGSAMATVSVPIQFQFTPSVEE